MRRDNRISFDDYRRLKESSQGSGEFDPRKVGIGKGYGGLFSRYYCEIQEGKPIAYQDLGWRATCGCGQGETVPAIVFDPFMGSGTTALVARRLGRGYVGTEINPEYCAMAERRLAMKDELFAQATR